MSHHLHVRRLARTLSRAGLGAFMLGVVLVALLPLAGYERYVITGGSMGQTIEKGSILWSKPIPTADLKVGDVITYTPPRDAGPEGMVTHRIAWVGRDRDGQRVYRTKGDANATVDPWRFRLDRADDPEGGVPPAVPRPRPRRGLGPPPPHDRRGNPRGSHRPGDAPRACGATPVGTPVRSTSGSRPRREARHDAGHSQRAQS